VARTFNRARRTAKGSNARMNAPAGTPSRTPSPPGSADRPAGFSTAARIAGSDGASALRIARNIGDPWFRCQALAHVAWHATDHRRFIALIVESLKSGWSIQNPNRSVTVIAWPVAALARRSYPGPDARERGAGILRGGIARLTEVIAKEPSPASRADALLLHIHASPSRPKLRKGVLGLLVKECRAPANRKRQRQLEEAALVIAADDPDEALELAVLLDEDRRRRATAKIEGQGEGLGARRFFEMSGTPR